MKVLAGCEWNRKNRLKAPLLCAVLIAVSLLMFFSGSDAAFSQAPNKAAKASATANLSDLRNHVYRVSPYTREMTRIRGMLDNKQNSRALTQLQALLNTGEDSFVVTASEVLSLRQEINRLLSEQPADVMDRYERTYGASAALLLKEALESDDPDLLTEVMQRFLHTKAGFEAMMILSRRMLDRGNPVNAVRLLKRVETATAHRSRVRSFGYQLLLANALSRVGRFEEVVELLENSKLPDNMKQRVTSAVVRPSDSTDVNEWNSPFGNPSHNRRTNATTPWLRPAWSLDFVKHVEEERSQDPNKTSFSLRSVLKSMAGKAKDGLTTVFQPVVANGTVVIREFDRVAAFELSTGKLRWSFDCSMRFSDRLGMTRSPTSRVMHDSVYGTISTDQQNVYLIDRSESSGNQSKQNAAPIVTQSRVRAPVRDGGSAAEFSTRNSSFTNQLVAVPLDATVDATGKATPKWILGGGSVLPEWFDKLDVDGNRLVTKTEFKTKTGFENFDRDKNSLISVAEAIATDGQRTPLADHFFLGPPLAVNDRLYCATEFAGRINVVAIDAETGIPLWIQGIAFPSRSIRMDTTRQRFMCTPVYTDGILVCPTNSDVLVGMNPVNGNLLWATWNGKPRSNLRLGRNTRTIRTVFDDRGFTSVPVINNGRIYYLPRYNRQVCCFDLATGESIWNSDPISYGLEKDRYVAAATDELALIVGNSFVRALDVRDGNELWKTPLKALSGRGIRSGNLFLQPLANGRVVTLDLKTGDQVGYSRSSEDYSNSSDEQSNVLPSDWSAGNLIAAGPWIVSVRPDRMDVLPQSGALLKQTLDRIANGQDSVENVLLSAELNLAMGRLEKSRTMLLALMKRDDAKGLAAPHSLMRELLYLALADPEQDKAVVLSELSDYCTEPNDRARFLVHQSRFDMNSNNHRQLLATTVELQRLVTNEPLSIDSNHDHQVSANAWTNGMFEQMAVKSTGTRKQVTDSLRQEFEKAIENRDQSRAIQLARSAPDSLTATRARLHIAKQLIAKAEFQRAEFLLLGETKSENEDAALEATIELAKLWNDTGLENEALLLLNEFGYRHPAAKSHQRIERGKQLLATTEGGRFAQKRMRPLSYTVKNASIEPVDDVSNMLLYESYGHGIQSPLPQPRGSGFQLFSRSVAPSGETRPRSFLTVIDRDTGINIGSIQSPSSRSIPSLVRHAHVGHFFPIGLHGEVQSVSLLQNASAPFWKTDLSLLGLKNSKASPSLLRVGPAGERYCCFQTQSALTVLDSYDGSLLWNRSDIAPNGGLIRDPFAGMFGDDKVIVLFSASDRSQYTVYRTSNGEIIRTGKLQTNTMLPREIAGRKLLYLAGSGDDLRFRLWDPLTDFFELDLPAYQPRPRVLLKGKLPTGELMLVTQEARLSIYNPATKKFLAQLHLPEVKWSDVSLVHGFVDQDTVFVGLKHKARFIGNTPVVAFPKTNPVTTESFSGDLLAIDRHSGKLKWRRPVSMRSFVQLPHDNLPFLISMTYQTDRATRRRDSVTIELIDKKTGRTFVSKKQLHMNRALDFVQTHHDSDKHVVYLRSVPDHVTHTSSTIAIHFHQTLQTSEDHLGPL